MMGNSARQRRQFARTDVPAVPVFLRLLNDRSAAIEFTALDMIFVSNWTKGARACFDFVLAKMSDFFPGDVTQSESNVTQLLVRAGDRVKQSVSLRPSAKIN
jgi:hypothetical protein